MTTKKINMADTRLTEEEIAAAVKVLRSGFLRQGPQVAAFEQAFREFAGGRFAVASSSGTAALHLAYLTFLKPGDEVLVPAFTFFATASAVILAGGKPVFCEVHPETFTLDVADAARKITPRTRALGPVHLFGNVCAVEQIQTLARKHNLKVVWDAAQAHGARYRGRDIGALGDFVCYSFYPTKNLFVGEGGMTLTDDGEAAELMKLYRSHGEGQKYQHNLIGYNYRMTDVEGAIGLAQMARLPGMLQKRREIAASFHNAFARIEGLGLQHIEENSLHAYHQYCFTVDPEKLGIDRDSLGERLQQAGIMTGVHYPLGLHEQPVFQKLYGKTSLPVTEDLRSRIMAIPVHHGLSEEDVAYIISNIKAALEL